MIAVMQPDLVRRHRLTVEEYFRMAEVGLLAPEAHVELIEGEIFDRAPIGNQHGGLTAWLHRRILRDLGERVSVWDQITLPLGRFSAPAPDLVILKYRQDEYRNKQPSPDDVLVIVEVSPWTRDTTPTRAPPRLRVGSRCRRYPPRRSI